VFHELHGALGQLLVVEGEVDMVRPGLSTTAMLLRQTAMVEPDDPTTRKGSKRVRLVRHPQDLLGEEGEVGGPTVGSESAVSSRGITIHSQWGKFEMLPARYDSGDKVGWGSTGYLDCFLFTHLWVLCCGMASGRRGAPYRQQWR
jgi:hypothetical protein